MPVQFRKQATTLQEKIDKAIQITYHMDDTGDAIFMRGFLIELLEKAFTKLDTRNATVVGSDSNGLDKIIEELKRNES